MKMNKIAAIAALCLSAQAYSQSVTFDTDTKDYASVGVYDTWEESPFRTGTLSGHVEVVANDDAGSTATDVKDNTKNILALERSIYGSNTFGARIDLQEADRFQLTTSPLYVHAYIKKPVAGRCMVVGLGKESDETSSEIEQCYAISSTVAADDWSDVVFPIKGNGDMGITIYSLVIIPDAESTHTQDQNFVCYIDEIEVNSSSTPRIAKAGDYVTNFDDGTETDRSDRYLISVGLSSPSKTGQSIAATTPQDLLYHNVTTSSFVAKAGETVTPSINYNGAWMSGYAYIDWGTDGKFSYDINSNGTPATGTDLVSYSYYNGLNSLGESVSSGNVITPPTFTIPASTALGFYRMRYKVDWNSLDPGGSNDETNLITSNGGAIMDVMLNVHEDQVTVNQDNRNGEVQIGGTTINATKVDFGKAFTIKMVPSGGFVYAGITIKHGYNLTGDSILHGNYQYRTVYISRTQFENDEYTIPAEYVDGDIMVQGDFREEGTLSDLCSVTYNVVDGEGNALQTYTYKVDKGSVYPNPFASECSSSYYSLTALPSETVSQDITLELVYKESFPFQITKSLDNVHLYKIYQGSDKNVLYGSADDTQMALSTSPSASDDYLLWYFMGDAFTGVKIYNVGMGKDMILSSSTTMSGTTGNGTYPILTTEPVDEGNNTYWAVTTSSNITGGFYLAQAGYPDNRMNNRDSYLAYWTGGADAGSTFTVEWTEDKALYAFITYHVVDTDGDAVIDTTFTVKSGEDYPTLSSECSSSYYTLTGIPSGTVSASGEYTLTYTSQFPFTVTKKLAQAAVYNLMIGSDKYYLYNTTGDISLTKTSVDSNNPTDYQWYFVGNAFTGFKIYNAAAGTGYILSSSTTMSGSTGAGTRPTLCSEPVGSAYNTYWAVTSSSNISGGFYLGQEGYTSNRMNNRNSYLAYWTGGADAGSTFTIDEIGEVNLAGDVDMDGDYDIADVTAAVNIVLNKDAVKPYKYNHEAADVNGDGNIDITDITGLVNIILNIGN